MPVTSHLSVRSLRILAALVREHIETGEPVGSQAIVRSAGLDISSATVRYELARLEELGYLHQPHTSAGRVPSDLGYRAYVDLLIQNRPSRRRVQALEADLRERAGTAALMDDLLSHVSHVVSQASHHVGFAMGPQHQRAVFHRIDFVPLAGTAVLAVIVIRGGEVSRRVVDVGRQIAEPQLIEAANYLNRNFAGLPLEELRTRLAEPLKDQRQAPDTVVPKALGLARAALEDPGAEHLIFIEGAASLLEEPAAAGGISIGTMRALLRMVEEKHRLAQLLSACLEDPGLNVVIGREHGSPDLREVAVVASTYSDGERVGGVGIIGPLRMRYARAIPLVESAAQAVSRLLRDSGWSSDSLS
ncbi:MAG: heat-inducible transcriptional repressor HrcA [Vicinamibacterales bacterium]